MNLCIVKETPIEQIYHIFMVSGHSHMEVDSVHSIIDKKSETLQVYVPVQWETIASIARINPYLIDNLQKDEIYNLKSLVGQLKMTNVTRNTEGEQVYCVTGKNCDSKNVISWMRYQKNSPNELSSTALPTMSQVI